MFVSQAQTDRFLMQQTHFVVRMLSAPGIAAIFTACSSSGSGKITPSDVAPDSQTRLAPSVPGSVVEFAYVANESSNNVSAYTINPTSGALTPVTGSPFGAGSVPHAVAVDPKGKFVYVVNTAGNNVSGYKIKSNGALTPLPGSPFEAGSGPGGIATCRVTAGKCIPPPL
jgi:DNA-binding beta-propeller fold protein YncE